MSNGYKKKKNISRKYSSKIGKKNLLNFLLLVFIVSLLFWLSLNIFFKKKFYEDSVIDGEDRLYWEERKSNSASTIKKTHVEDRSAQPEKEKPNYSNKDRDYLNGLINQ
jgi:hypothetical protein